MNSQSAALIHSVQTETGGGGGGGAEEGGRGRERERGGEMSRGERQGERERGAEEGGRVGGGRERERGAEEGGRGERERVILGVGDKIRCNSLFTRAVDKHVCVFSSSPRPKDYSRSSYI